MPDLPFHHDESNTSPDHEEPIESIHPHEREGDDEAPGTQGMIPGRRHRRNAFERISMRILATGGIIGLDVALGAILVANHVRGWIDGLVIGVVSVVLAAVLWSSRQL